jgi:hypothetical protein
LVVSLEFHRQWKSLQGEGVRKWPLVFTLSKAFNKIGLDT